MAMTDDVPADWTLEPLLPEERDLLRRLFELYLYDFSEMEHADVDPQGWFLPDASRYVGRYWTEPDRHALLLRVNGNPAGFALVVDHSPLPDSGHRRYISDFFVMRAYRRAGYGTAMARATLLRWPGEWQVLEIRANANAQVIDWDDNPIGGLYVCSNAMSSATAGVYGGGGGTLGPGMTFGYIAGKHVAAQPAS